MALRLQKVRKELAIGCTDFVTLQVLGCRILTTKDWGREADDPRFREPSSLTATCFLRLRSGVLTLSMGGPVAVKPDDICYRGVGASAALRRHKGRGGFFLKIRMMVAITFLELLDRHAEESGRLPPIGV